ncbi:protein kinase family protein [Paenibacillus sp. NEAU-GSW1]|uniref:serine/threonine protein kinase n=1 Tax=Paenibacillus sp. NEAU-GSW1 TaxID=2682486 RepID=UPI0012E1CEFB|nr:protein kinase family protein [Paenibacillus sp. NEAU-GSW1]MUT64830.1 protein kinase [Paenibacillus sp. NEAU-GSW1]
MLGAWFKQVWRNWMDYPLRPGQIWAGKYRVEHFLGMGSYGQAYRAVDLATGGVVLMKRAKPSKGKSARKMLGRESEMMQRLDHPQIPQRLEDAAHRGEKALVMAFAEGETLEDSILGLRRAFTQQEALRIVRELLRPLRHLHEAGYVHRDVRTPNVIECGERVFLIDFGLACRIGELPSDERKTVDEREPSGFADSWGPVKKRMRDPYPTSDLYGLGHLFLFMMYAGYTPYEGQEERGWEEELELEPEVKRFVQGLLESRWMTAAECEAELEVLLSRIKLGAENDEVDAASQL